MAFPLKKYYANTPCTFVGTGDIVYIPDDVEVTELEPTTGAIMMVLNDKGSQLPPGYTRIAYLENASIIYSGASPACLIDTGLHVSNDTRVEVTGTPLEKTWVDVFCSGGASMIVYNFNQKQPQLTYVYGDSIYRTDVLTSFGQKYNIVADGRDFYIDGKKQERFNLGYSDLCYEIPEKEPFETETYYLFMRDPRYGCGKARIYDFNVRNGDIQEADYVPVVDPAGVPCMYDKVTKTPKYARSKSAIFAGIETLDQLAQLSNNLPVATPVYNSSGVQTGPTITLSMSSGFANSEYLSIAMDRITSKNWIVAIHEWVGGLMSDEMSFVPASFLESDGQQYIITAAAFDSSSELTYESQICANLAGIPVGSLTGSTDGRLYATEYNNTPDPWFFFGYGKTGISTSQKNYFEIRDRHKIAIKKAQLYLNRELILQAGDDGSSFDGTPLGLFGRVKNINGVLEADFLYKGIIFSCALKKAGVLAAQFIPSLDNTGTPCMYDTITKKPFYNVGSGNFILGVETEYNLDAIIANLTTATPEYDTDGTTQIGPVIKISVPSTWSVDISDGSTSFAKKMYDAAFEKQYILQFSQH